MKTLKPFPGKFEGNESQLMAQAVYSTSLNGANDEFGDCSEYGLWCGLIIGKRYGFIIDESDQGFVSVWYGSKEEAKEKFEFMKNEWEAALPEDAS